MSSAIHLRSSAPEDRDFLWKVYASTREEELKLVGWSEAQKTAFVDMQFRAQHDHYARHYPQADFSVIEADGVPVGRLYVDDGPREIRVVDIALLPEHRGHGIGTQLMTGLQDRARRAGKPVSIHVEQFNPAMRWYVRLGFRPMGDAGVYVLMEWSPAG